MLPIIEIKKILIFCSLNIKYKKTYKELHAPCAKHLNIYDDDPLRYDANDLFDQYIVLEVWSIWPRKCVWPLVWYKYQHVY